MNVGDAEVREEGGILGDKGELHRRPIRALKRSLVRTSIGEEHIPDEELRVRASCTT